MNPDDPPSTRPHLWRQSMPRAQPKSPWRPPSLWWLPGKAASPCPHPGGGCKAGRSAPPLGGLVVLEHREGQACRSWGRGTGGNVEPRARIQPLWCTPAHSLWAGLGWAGLGGAAGTTSSSHSCWAAGAGRPPGRGPSRCCRGWSWVPGTHSSSRRWSPRGARRPVSR